MSGRLLIVRVQLRQTELAAARRIMKFLWIVGWWDEDAILDVSQLFFLILGVRSTCAVASASSGNGVGSRPPFFLFAGINYDVTRSVETHLIHRLCLHRSF
jgi:hypothetical protein